MLYVLHTNYASVWNINLKINYHQVSLTTTTYNNKNSPIITIINQDLPEQLHLLEKKNPPFSPYIHPKPLTPPNN